MAVLEQDKQPVVTGGYSYQITLKLLSFLFENWFKKR
ncbi:Uncharacterised protein [Streptococcus suis]|uniref:Uncharacterized protein n=1 Tax=Streptococcus suis TaxID=1307 RepID=A0A116LSL5_STRSU|nr:Uncharacterised protein [Streptococcus suis]